jgi:hypothetical protein
MRPLSNPALWLLLAVLPPYAGAQPRYRLTFLPPPPTGDPSYILPVRLTDAGQVVGAVGSAYLRQQHGYYFDGSVAVDVARPAIPANTNWHINDALPGGTLVGTYGGSGLGQGAYFNEGNGGWSSYDGLSPLRWLRFGDGPGPPRVAQTGSRTDARVGDAVNQTPGPYYIQDVNIKGHLIAYTEFWQSLCSPPPGPYLCAYTDQDLALPPNVATQGEITGCYSIGLSDDDRIVGHCWFQRTTGWGTEERAVYWPAPSAQPIVEPNLNYLSGVNTFGQQVGMAYVEAVKPGGTLTAIASVKFKDAAGNIHDLDQLIDGLPGSGWRTDAYDPPRINNNGQILTHVSHWTSTWPFVDYQPVLLTPFRAGRVTIRSEPDMTFTISGEPQCGPGNYTTPAVFDWPGGASCDIAFPSPQASGGQNRLFSHWQDGGLSSRRTIKVDGDTDLMAFWGPAPPCAEDITAGATIKKGGFIQNFATGLFSQTVTVSGLARSGPVALVLDGLSPGARLANAAGYTTCAMPAGSPYVFFNAAPGGTAPIVLQFQTIARPAYAIRLLAGGETR